LNYQNNTRSRNLKKIKVAIICHFSNEEIRKRLPLSNLLIRNIIQKIRFKPLFKYQDFAIWNSILFKEIEKYTEEFEFHIIAPHLGLKKKLVEFQKNYIYYHIFKSDDDSLIFFAKKRILKTKIEDRYKGNCKIVSEIISNVKPDIINLIGSENPYYSMTALGIKNIPVYLTCQTVYTNPLRKEIDNDFNEMRWNIELKLHKAIQYFGCAGKLHRDLILSNNPNATILKHTFPIDKPEAVKKIDKKYDFIFYSVYLSQKKGILDAIYALGLVKMYHKDVTLCVIGEYNKQMKKAIDNAIIKNNLYDNIRFYKPFKKHSDLYEMIEKCKYAILPVKLDIISSSVIEAMSLGLPVVTYKTTGTPLLNKEKQCVLLSNINDIYDLALNMRKLLENPEFAAEIANNAKEYVNKYFDNSKNIKKLISDYKAVIMNYNKQAPIPKELLFDINEFEE